MIDATVDVTPVLKSFERLKRVDGRKVFREARRPVRTDIKEHAKAQSSPEGRWTPLAASTVERRSRGGRRRRGRMLGRLPAANKITSGVDFVRAVSIPKWSRVHHAGGVAGHGSKIPSRQWLYITKKLVRSVRTLWVDAIKRAWAGR